MAQGAPVGRGRRQGRGEIDSKIVLVVFAMIGLTMIILAVSACPPILAPIFGVCEPLASPLHS